MSRIHPRAVQGCFTLRRYRASGGHQGYAVQNRCVMRSFSEEFIAILRDDRPGPASLSNTALLYFNRQTLNKIKMELGPPAEPYPYSAQPFRRHVETVLVQMFGIPIMLYHGIPIDKWELVQRASGENINGGWVWAPERAPQLTDLGVCQNQEHVTYAHLRANSCIKWEWEG